MRILVVDDEEHLRRVMRMTLEADGYEVVEAGDGEEALRLFGDGAGIDATLLDQRMPGIDGLETLRRMRAVRADACIIMVTAYATIELAVEAMKLGATDFVRKPMTPDTLRHAVAAALAKRAGVATAAAGRAAAAPAPVPERLSPPEIWTTNGFFIRGVKQQPGDRPTDHRFVVRRGKDQQGSDVVVSIDERLVAKVARESRRNLAADGGFWHRQAEHALMSHLWSEAALPAGGRLVLDAVSGRAIDDAVQWTGD